MSTVAKVVDGERYLHALEEEVWAGMLESPPAVRLRLIARLVLRAEREDVTASLPCTPDTPPTAASSVASVSDTRQARPKDGPTARIVQVLRECCYAMSVTQIVAELTKRFPETGHAYVHVWLRRQAKKALGRAVVVRRIDVRPYRYVLASVPPSTERKR